MEIYCGGTVVEGGVLIHIYERDRCHNICFMSSAHNNQIINKCSLVPNCCAKGCLVLLFIGKNIKSRHFFFQKR
jgi:hypothetical protein